MMGLQNSPATGRSRPSCNPPGVPVSRRDESDEEDQQNASGGISRKGRIYTLSYMDNSAYNGPYNLFFRVKEGWILFEDRDNPLSLLRILETERQCPLTAGSGVILTHDTQTGVMARMYGEWYSRSLFKHMLVQTIGSFKASSIRYFPGHVVLKRTLDGIRDFCTGFYGYGVRTKQKGSHSLHTLHPTPPQPPIGHATIVIGRYDKGFIFFPSFYQQISRVLFAGGSSKAKARVITDAILDRLGVVDPAYNTQPLLELSKVKARLSESADSTGSHSCTFIPDEQGRAPSLLGYISALDDTTSVTQG